MIGPLASWALNGLISKVLANPIIWTAKSMPKIISKVWIKKLRNKGWPLWSLLDLNIQGYWKLL